MKYLLRKSGRACVRFARGFTYALLDYNAIVTHYKAYIDILQKGDIKCLSEQKMR